MLQRYDWTFARTETVEDPAEAEQNFRRLVGLLDKHLKGFENYPARYRDESELGNTSKRAGWDQRRDRAIVQSFTAAFVHCPAMQFQLPNGMRPFVVDTSLGAAHGRAETFFESADEERFQKIWPTVVDQRLKVDLYERWTCPENADMSFSCQFRSRFEPDDSDNLVYQLVIELHPRTVIPASFPKHPTDDDWSPEVVAKRDELETILAASGLRDVSAKRTTPALTSRFQWLFGDVNPHEVPRVYRHLEEAAEAGANWRQSDSVSLNVFETLNSYKRIRNGRCYDDVAGELNRLDRDWNTEFAAFYHADFDPFADPEIIPEEAGEIRLPIGQLKNSPIHFDLVHVVEGTFVEARSGNGETSLRRIEEIASTELEYWRGRPSDRWIEPTD